MNHGELLQRERRRRDEAIDRAEVNADDRWLAVAEVTVITCALELVYFTADDWRDRMPPEVTTHDKRALGPVFLRCARNGWIRNTGRQVQSRYRHADLLPVWAKADAPIYIHAPVREALDNLLDYSESDESLYRLVDQLETALLGAYGG
jgi:hypothetical protein